MRKQCPALFKVWIFNSQTSVWAKYFRFAISVLNKYTGQYRQRLCKYYKVAIPGLHFPVKVPCRLFGDKPFHGANTTRALLWWKLQILQELYIPSMFKTQTMCYGNVIVYSIHKACQVFSYIRYIDVEKARKPWPTSLNRNSAASKHAWNHSNQHNKQYNCLRLHNQISASIYRIRVTVLVLYSIVFTTQTTIKNST
jgi:hypothetical protein